MKDETTQNDVKAAVQPRILFKPTSWLAKIDFINHLILFNNVLITVLSEKEGGKTSFNTLLQNNLDQQIKSVAMTLTPPCQPEEFITQIATELHLNYDQYTDIGSLVNQINERKAHVLLIIDNAQNLPEDLVKQMMLALKNQENFGFFHVCLVSDYSIVATLNHLAIDQFNNLVHTIELGPLNESETRTYVLQRAMNARLINRPLTDLQFKQFYQLTKGNLAKINSSLEAFIYQCGNPKKKNQFNTFRKAAVAASVLVAITASYLVIDFKSEPTQLPQPIKEPVSVTATVGKKLNTLFSGYTNKADSKPMLSEIPFWLDSAKHQFVEFALPTKQNLDLDLYAEETEEEDLNTVAVLDKVVIIPRLQPKRDVPAHNLVADKPAINANTVVAIAKAAKPVAHKIAAQQKMAKTNSPVKAGKPVKSKAGSYTIQLAASHKAADVHRFKKNNPLLAKAKVRHFTNEKGDWYILTLGEFSSRGEAQGSVNKLPKALAKLSPWVRAVSGLDSVG